MPKFACTIVESVVYRVEVEADDEDEARLNAEEAFVQAEDLNAFFVSVEERTVDYVEEIKE